MLVLSVVKFVWLQMISLSIYLCIHLYMSTQWLGEPDEEPEPEPEPEPDDDDEWSTTLFAFEAWPIADE